MLNGIHHVAIICSDYAKSKAFYEEVLECEVIDENYREERDSYKCDLKLPDGNQIELFSFPGAPVRPSGPEAQGLRHLSFRVSDVGKAVQWLNNKGVACEDIRIDPFTVKAFTFFKDPDDIPLELYQVD